jgi:hypothetical protein
MGNVKSLHYYIIMGLLGYARMAQASFGQSAALLMAEPLNVRPIGMSGAFVSQADDESSIESNPAGLAKVRGFSLGGGQLIGLDGLQASQLNLVAALSPQSSLGLEAAYLYDTDTYRDIYGNAYGSFGNSNLLADLAYGQELGQGRWSLGGAVKALQESYALSNSLSLAADLGLQGPVWKGIRFGAVAQNLGAQLQSQSGSSSPLPLRFQGGLSLPFFMSNWKLNLEAQDLPEQGQWRSLIGTELKLDLGTEDPKTHELPLRASLRAGFSNGLAIQEAGEASFGAGLELPPAYALDYALASNGDLGAIHRISLTLRFPGAKLPSPAGAELAAPYHLQVTEEADGILLSWEDPNARVDGYNLYADYGVMVDRINSKPVTRRFQKLTHVDKSRLYHFYLKPLGSDGKEGPSSEVLDYRAK